MNHKTIYFKGIKILLLGTAVFFSACQLQSMVRPTQDVASPTGSLAQAKPAQSLRSPESIAEPRQEILSTVEKIQSTSEESTVETTIATASNDTVLEIKKDAATPSSESSPLFVPPSTDNLWDRVRQGMALDKPEQESRIQSELNWYKRNPSYFERVSDRADPFLYMIMEQVEKRNMPAEVALLPIIESAYDPFAYSHGRAAGIWQFIPGTGKLFGLKQNWWYDGRRDVLASTEAALDYLEHLHKRFDGDWLLALAAYNSGEGAVSYAVKKNLKKGKPTDFWHLDLSRETQSYVPKLLAVSMIVENPSAYNISLKPIANEQKVAVVNTEAQIDMALAAELAGMELEELYRLNPGYNRWATDPNGPHRLLVPVEQAETLKTALEKTPPEKRIQWKRHRIASGESLITIAKKYHTTVALLQDINNLRGHTIRAGHYLIIPSASRDLSSYTLTEQQRHQSRLSAQRTGTKIIHTVQSGDTFWDLGKKYSVPVYRIADWNGMAPADTLKPGQKLVMWLKPKSVRNVRVSAAQVVGQGTTIRKIHYTVRQGDSLARISSRFNVTVQQLRNWNQLPKGRYLQPGQRLMLYVDVTQQT